MCRVPNIPQRNEDAGKEGEPAGCVTDRGVGEPDGLERLWAPYRMDYITMRPDGTDAKSGGCSKGSGDPFVDAPKMSDEDALIVARGQEVYCILNLFPYNAGHMMVIPYRQVVNIEDLTASESREMMEFAQEAVRTLKQVSHPDGVNIGFNLGHGSGGSVRSHLHMHVVPRWSGDANFMTILGGTKVLPQLLSTTRQLLAESWGRAC